MEGFQCVAKVEDIPPGQVKVVKVNERAIAVFNIEGHFHAIYNACPHEGGPLNKGRVKGHVVFEMAKAQMGVAIASAAMMCVSTKARSLSEGGARFNQWTIDADWKRLR